MKLFKFIRELVALMAVSIKITWSQMSPRTRAYMVAYWIFALAFPIWSFSTYGLLKGWLVWTLAVLAVQPIGWALGAIDSGEVI